MKVLIHRFTISEQRSSASRLLGGKIWIWGFLAFLLGPSSVNSAPVYELLRSFGNPDGMGTGAYNPPVEGSDGFLYGTTFFGGTKAGGTAYRVAKDGSGYKVIHQFGSASATESGYSQGRLIQGSDGRLYGTGQRTIYGMDKTGANFTVLKLFSDASDSTDPQDFRDGLLQASDGRLYGVSRSGGTEDRGTVFRINRDGAGFQVLKNLSGTGTNAEPDSPTGPLIEGSDGILYGASMRGGTLDRGTIFRLSKDGSNWQVLRNFGGNSTSTSAPRGGLVEGPDGVLYGLALGGPGGGGAVYKINRDGTGYSIIWSWSTVGGVMTNPVGELSLGGDGFLYGQCISDGAGGNGGIFKLSLTGTDHTTVYAFPRNTVDGVPPSGGVLVGTDGNLYSVAAGNNSGLWGVMRRVSKAGADYRVIHVFSSTGGDPSGPSHVLQGRDKRLYITNTELNVGLGPCLSRCRSSGSDFNVLYIYRQNDSLREPTQGLVQASDGDFYGVSYFGTVFALRNGGSTYSGVHDFNAGTGPHSPSGPVLEASDGLLYGLARGSNPGGPYEGVIYRVAKDGSGFTVLRQFTGGATDLRDGTGKMVEDANGKLYGMAPSGGPTNSGGIFTIAKDGSGYQVLRFATGSPNLSFGLLLGSDGVLYGVGTSGAQNGVGSVFKINRDGTGYAVILAFPSATGRPRSGLIENGDGKLYGVTSTDNNSTGVLFSIPKSGTSFTTAHTFGPVALNYVAKGGDGFLYGTTLRGGTYGYGTIWRYGEAPEITVLNDFNQSVESGSAGPAFGVIRAGATQTKTITIRNDGQLPLGPFTASFTGAQAANFKTTAPTGSLAPGATASLTITFAPMLPGANAATLRLGSNDYDEASFELGLNGSAISPEIALHDGLATAAELTDGQTTAVDFGEIRQAAPQTRTFTVANTGTAPLLVTNVTVPGGFSLLDLPTLPFTIPVAGETAFRVQINATSLGLFSGNLVISSDDLDESIFNFPIKATVVSPEIVLHDGDATAPQITDGQENVVDFGIVRQASQQTRNLTLANTGTAPLLVSNIVAPNGYSLLDLPTVPFTIPVAGTRAFRLQIIASALGTYSGDVEITSDDLDETVFNFPITGKIVSPEIVLHDGNAAAPELADDQAAVVDFGTVRQAQPMARTFTISNTGTAPLLVNNIAVPVGHSLKDLPPLPFIVPEAGVSAFKVQIDAQALGTFGGDVVIATDDLDEAVFSFPIEGTIVSPEIELHAGGATGNEILDAQNKAIDFGRNVQGTPGKLNFTLKNVGTAPLLVTVINLPTGYEGTLPTLPLTLAVGQTTTFPICLTTTTVGVHSGNVLITSDDLDETEFSFPITGGIYIPKPGSVVVNSSSTVNHQTGLREQQVKIVNNTTATVPAYYVIIRGLPAGVKLNNASGTRPDGSPFLYIQKPLKPHQTIVLLLEYYSLTRLPAKITPKITTEVVLEPINIAAQGSGGLKIDRITSLPGGAVLIEFPTTIGKRYEVEYSSDGTNWKASRPLIRAAASRTQWIDRGPPRTSSLPGSSKRYYRVRRVLP